MQQPRGARCRATQQPDLAVRAHSRVIVRTHNTDIYHEGQACISWDKSRHTCLKNQRASFSLSPSLHSTGSSTLKHHLQCCHTVLSTCLQNYAPLPDQVEKVAAIGQLHDNAEVLLQECRT